jgi:hypothetical protein
MKIVWRSASIAGPVRLIAAGIAAAFCIVVSASSVTLAAGPMPPLPLLHADGGRIVDASGNQVVLAGVNLGGWLVEEPWMQPFTTDPPPGSSDAVIQDHVSIWGEARKRFGEAGMEKLRTAFRDNWITASDFDRIHAYGLNCVRLPFLSSLVDEPGGLHWLDQAIGWAGERHIYVILDMHGAPGCQSGEAHTGQKNLNRFFSDPSNVARAAAIWKELAERYRGNPAVAGYDLLNEPTGSPNSDTLYVVQERLYDAIRSVDSRHIVFMEDGYSGVQWMPFPHAVGWDNVAYSAHYYDFGAKSESDQRGAFDGYVAGLIKERGRRDIPYYIGEFCYCPNGTGATFAHGIALMKSSGISFTSWTYKVMWTNGGESLWSIYSNAKPVPPLNLYSDTLAQLLAKCDELRTENLDLNPDMDGALRSAAAK